MIKKSKDQLFSLIKSLTRHEKRYFQVNSPRRSGDKSNNLIRLFQLLDNQDEYDEPAIKEQLSGDSLGMQYAVYKNLLFHALLRSLQSYRYEYSPGMQVRSGIDKVEILVEKGDQQAALRMLHRTRKCAETYGQTGYYLELSAWERRLQRGLNPLGYLEALPGIESRERKWAQIIAQEAEALQFYDRLFAWAQVERRMEKSSISDQLVSVGKQLETLAENANRNFTTFSTLLNAQALYRQLSGDYRGMMRAYSELLTLWDEHPKIKSAFPKRYARVQIAWLNSALAAGEVGSHLPQIRALRKMPVQRIAEQARTVFQSYNLELLWLLDQKDVEAAIRFLPSFEAKLADLKPFLDEIHLTSFYLNVAFVYFQRRDYRGALSWANRLQSMETQNQNTLFFRSAFIISLICHCETGDFSAAESALRSLDRRLRKHDSDWEFGKVIFGWIRQLVAKWGLPEHKRLKQGLHLALKEIEVQKQPVPFILHLVKAWAGNG